MLVLTEEIGQPVRDAAGTKLGRVHELVVDAADPRATVVRVGVRRGRGPLRWAHWADLVAYERSGVQLQPGAVLVDGTSASGRTDLWLRRDVLDAQILDGTGARLVRVGDLVLLRTGGDLRVVAVQFGAGPVLRRLGLRRVAERFPTSSIDWRELHLVSGRGLAAQLATSGDHLGLLDHAQLAPLVAQMASDRAGDLLGTVGAPRAADALRLTHPDVRGRVVHALPADFATEVLHHMPSDDAAATLRDVHRTRRLELLDELDRTQAPRAADLRRLVAADRGTVHRLMSTDLRVAPVGTAPDALRDVLRRDPPVARGLATVFLVDGDGRPVGELDARALLEEEPRAARPTTVPASAPIADVVDLFATRDLLAVAVVDHDGRLVGAVAVDDVLGALVAERRPGRSRYRHLLARHRTPRGPRTPHGRAARRT